MGKCHLRMTLGLQNPWGSKLWGMTLGEQLFSTLGDKISVLIID